MSKIHLQKNGWPTFLKKKRVCYDMKGNSKMQNEKGPHKHLFLDLGVRRHGFLCNSNLERK
jgi:hypothetical protein